MNSTVILLVENNDSDVLKSVNSVLNSSEKPTNVCIMASSSVNNKTLETIKALFRSCCSDEPYTENREKNYTLINKKLHNISFHYLIVNDITSKTLLQYGIEYILDETDIFITLSSGNEYRIDAISTLIKSLKDDNVGLSYSDYIDKNKYVHLGSINSSLIYPSHSNRYNYNIKEISFKKKYILSGLNPSDFNSSLSIVKFLYNRSIIRHIPEPLFTT
jgi:hypothetical protein